MDAYLLKWEKKVKLWLKESFVIPEYELDISEMEQILRISWSQIPAANEFKLLVSNIQNIQSLLAIPTETYRHG